MLLSFFTIAMDSSWFPSFDPDTAPLHKQLLHLCLHPLNVSRSNLSRQGSAALLAEKNVLIEQLNVTLIQALYHMEPDQRTSAAQAVGNLNLPLKVRRACSLFRACVYSNQYLHALLMFGELPFSSRCASRNNVLLATEPAPAYRIPIARVLQSVIVRWPAGKQLDWSRKLKGDCTTRRHRLCTPCWDDSLRCLLFRERWGGYRLFLCIPRPNQQRDMDHRGLEHSSVVVMCERF